MFARWGNAFLHHIYHTAANSRRGNATKNDRTIHIHWDKLASCFRRNVGGWFALFNFYLRLSYQKNQLCPKMTKNIYIYFIFFKYRFISVFFLFISSAVDEPREHTGEANASRDLCARAIWISGMGLSMESRWRLWRKRQHIYWNRCQKTTAVAGFLHPSGFLWNMKTGDMLGKRN